MEKSAISNVNIFSGQSGEPQLEVKGVFYYNNKLYILEILQADLLKKTYNDFLARHFGIEKTLELFIHKYYWPKMRANMEKYIQGCDIYISSKAQKRKLYSSLQLLPVLIYKCKDLMIDFVIGLLKSKDW